ncbi:MFS multidrug transporter-like protein [Eremomyces bilateralis CBS 781.70]|uniref:MFS multidrug transporter-like protein n=1 Tax=Eremomyces bilateralis CBS 781.70 TaxID=1392243 RepID=A0A6G1G448_9PEZI|nr:MFS multidrug transporter-like protein [Eremomyces bilateralis CBS 781.70]KAF1812690.1 MFS multidrug transporter-like protein [Eremomyces bilateralis CBS 781.70]
MSSGSSVERRHEVVEKGSPTELEQVHTAEKVPGHDNYYEKDGLRTYGDGLDHDHEPKMTFKRFMSLVSMALLWTGSQIPVYLYGGAPPYIYGDIGGSDRWTWFIIANLLALAAVCPFVGSISDLIGRRYVAMIGASFLVIGNIIGATAKSMNIFIAGHVFMGAGAGINELTALAAASEMAPTRKRGTYIAALIFTIIPFVPSVLYAQLICYYATWRYIGLFCGVWAFVGLLGIAFFYFPPPRVNSAGLSRKQVIAEIDFIGGFLSISGMILFMMGLQWGGSQYKWATVHVLVPLILGALILIVFAVWEAKWAKHPMFPHRLKQNPRVLALTLVITFISGANFFAVLMFWPTQAFNVYGHDPVGIGLRGLPIGLAIMTGACVVLVLISVLRGQIRALMVASSVLMTAGCGAMAIGETDNMHQLWGILVLAGLGIGGILVPASIITTIICPDDLIATVAALTLAIRVIGGVIGYSVYYNVFVNKFTENAKFYIGGLMVTKLGIYDVDLITEVIELTGASQTDEIAHLPGLDNPVVHAAIVKAGQIAFAASYKFVYYASIPFGVLCIFAAAFLGDISKYMDDHVAVVIT